jgi:ubiquinone/menaquinone biosynthesis C-methylase UbiE
MVMNNTEIKDAVRKSWDCSSETYDKSPGHMIGTQEEKDAWKRELSQNLPQSPQAILDVGCGTGAMGLLFAEMGHYVTGVDLSEAMMAKARQKAAAQKLSMDLRTGDAEHLSFDEGTFDVVVNRHLLWTLPHPEVALKEWHRVLKTGGMVLIIDGVWKDKSFSIRTKRMVSDGLAKIFDRTNHSHYDKKLRSQLPYDGGVPHETMVSYLERAGFTDLCFRDLMYIRDMQKPQQPWYRRFAPGKTYYILAAKKQDKK